MMRPELCARNELERASGQGPPTVPVEVILAVVRPALAVHRHTYRHTPRQTNRQHIIPVTRAVYLQNHTRFWGSWRP